MTFHDLALICFAAGSVIHGTQTVLAAKLRRQAGCDPSAAIDGMVIGVTTFFWQFGNFLLVFFSTPDFQGTGVVFRIGQVIRDAALVCFPLLFSYMCLHIHFEVAPASRRLLALGSALRFPLWPW